MSSADTDTNTKTKPESFMAYLSTLKGKLWRVLAKFLTSPRSNYHAFSTIDTKDLLATLQIGDLILVEGNNRISSVIKYLTQSTWSHVAIYIGETQDIDEGTDTIKGPILEADLLAGVHTVPLSKYENFNLRICRPVSMSDKDKTALIDYVIERIGHQYDNKNIFDLMRYLMPTPPLPQRFRRRLLEFGSGDPTKVICSTLVAQAFQSIQYPILPIYSEIEEEESPWYRSRRLHKIFSKRHHSLFTPRDFDLSPYFEIIKPTVMSGFDYKKIVWKETPAPIDDTYETSDT